jgi:hypothetical protein
MSRSSGVVTAPRVRSGADEDMRRVSLSTAVCEGIGMTKRGSGVDEAARGTSSPMRDRRNVFCDMGAVLLVDEEEEGEEDSADDELSLLSAWS